MLVSMDNYSSNLIGFIKAASAPSEGMEKQALNIYQLLRYGTTMMNRGKGEAMTARLAARNRAIDKVRVDRTVAANNAKPMAELEQQFLGHARGPASREYARLQRRVPAADDRLHGSIKAQLTEKAKYGDRYYYPQSSINKNLASPNPMPYDAEQLGSLAKAMRYYDKFGLDNIANAPNAQTAFSSNLLKHFT